MDVDLQARKFRVWEGRIVDPQARKFRVWEGRIFIGVPAGPGARRRGSPGVGTRGADVGREGMGRMTRGSAAATAAGAGGGGESDGAGVARAAGAGPGGEDLEVGGGPQGDAAGETEVGGDAEPHPRHHCLGRGTEGGVDAAAGQQVTERQERDDGPVHVAGQSGADRGPETHPGEEPAHVAEVDPGLPAGPGERGEQEHELGGGAGGAGEAPHGPHEHGLGDGARPRGGDVPDRLGEPGLREGVGNARDGVVIARGLGFVLRRFAFQWLCRGWIGGPFPGRKTLPHLPKHVLGVLGLQSEVVAESSQERGHV
mmetsp:Transcript_69808/g.117243  ORF Transcript_69808/g.117243 Transcript_69808/m.117243 type:complete len:313 (+) Transcript_69808:878-1816(+)